MKKHPRKNANKNSKVYADIFWIIIIIIALCSLAGTCQGQYKVQNFKLNSATGHWEAVGDVYSSPDTLTTIHRYKWKGKQIIAMQDYKKINNKWIKYGSQYAAPDTLRLVHAFVK